MSLQLIAHGLEGIHRLDKGVITRRAESFPDGLFAAEESVIGAAKLADDLSGCADNGIANETSKSATPKGRSAP